MSPFFYFLSFNRLWYSFLYLEIVKIHDFLRWKLWNQNFVWLDSGNIHIKESKYPSFTFSKELRTKFVWSHGLIDLQSKSMDSFLYDWDLHHEIVNEYW